LASAKDLTILSMADRYGRPVRYRRESAQKSRAQGDPSSLGDYINAIQHISMEEYETISRAWEKSAADSAEPKQ
jgi:hypothetical protein